MHPDDRITSLRLSYYIAPPHRSEVIAQKLAPGLEYVELILRGGVFFEEDDKELYCGPGTIFWHFPGEYTVCRYQPEAPYECFVAIFGIAPPNRRIAPRRTEWDSPAEIQKFTGDSLRAYHDDSYDKAVLARAVHARLLSAAYSAGHAAPGRELPRVLEKALMLIDREYGPGMNVGELAERLCVSAPHLHMLFRKHLGETPHRYLSARRLQEARNLLATSAMHLKTLAYECGFPSVEHFCRLFKTRFGMTPSEYRRKNAPFPS